MAEEASARVGGKHDAEETLPLGLPRPGDVVAGRYLVERELGGGAMGIVLEALDRAAGGGEKAQVAIKFLKGARARHESSATRFLQEARATRALRSAYVVRVLDVGVLDAGTPYFVMERLRGETMLDRLRALRPRPLPLEEAVDAVVEACAAMDEAHARGIVHRDLKPANLFRTIDEAGRPRVKVLDFGVSKVLEDAEDPELTNTTDMLGSPHYMSPEQLRSAKHVDHRTDIWSLGVALHRLLTGQPAFAGQNLTAVTAAVMADAPTLPSALRPDLPKGLDAIVAHCLEKEPSERFESAAALGRALVPFGSERARLAAATFVHPATSGSAVQAAEDAASPRGRSRSVALAGAAAALVLALVSGIAVARRDDGSTASSRAAPAEPTASIAATATSSAPSVAVASGTTVGESPVAGANTVPPIVAASTPPKPKKPTKLPVKSPLATKGAKTASPAATSTSPWGSVIDDRK